MVFVFFLASAEESSDKRHEIGGRGQGTGAGRQEQGDMRMGTGEVRQETETWEVRQEKETGDGRWQTFLVFSF